MRKKGFTLVELLVVIAIIALLLSIMMPALNKVRDQARTVICKSNLKQWGIITAIYTSQNNDNYFVGDISNWNTIWFGAFYDLIKQQKDGSFTSCPMAIRPNTKPSDMNPMYLYTLGSPKLGWTIRNTSPQTFWNRPDVHGSYGWNAWACNPPSRILVQWGMFDTQYNWRKASAKSANKIPIMFDCTASSEWFATATLYKPTVPNPDYRGGGVFAERHINKKYVNVLVMDLSVPTVGLKGLFKFKWNNKYNENQDILETTRTGNVPDRRIMDYPADIR